MAAKGEGSEGGKYWEIGISRWRAFILSTARKHSIAYMYHIFFIHPSVSGHFGCSHVVATVNSAALNIWVHVSLHIVILSGYMPRSRIAES